MDRPHSGGGIGVTSNRPGRSSRDCAPSRIAARSRVRDHPGRGVLIQSDRSSPHRRSFHEIEREFAARTASESRSEPIGDVFGRRAGAASRARSELGRRFDELTVGHGVAKTNVHGRAGPREVVGDSKWELFVFASAPCPLDPITRSSRTNGTQRRASRSVALRGRRGTSLHARSSARFGSGRSVRASRAAGRQPTCGAAIPQRVRDPNRDIREAHGGSGLGLGQREGEDSLPALAAQPERARRRLHPR